MYSGAKPVCCTGTKYYLVSVVCTYHSLEWYFKVVLTPLMKGEMYLTGSNESTSITG